MISYDHDDALNLRVINPRISDSSLDAFNLWPHTSHGAFLIPVVGLTRVMYVAAKVQGERQHHQNHSCGGLAANAA